VPPLKWDPATDGPDSVASSRWLQEFERSQLPPDTVFPKPGQVWQARRDCVVGVIAIMELKDGEILPFFATAGLVPHVPFGPARLVKGEKIRIIERTDSTESSCPRPLLVNFRSLRHKEMEKKMVLQKIRALPEYQDYALQIATARPKACLSPEDTYLNKDFELVEDVV
jgi:hypothetical protein